MPDAVTAAISLQVATPDAPKAKNAAEAARQFEAILIGQMLRSAHSDSGISGSDEDSTSNTMWDLAAQQFSQLLAEKGGLGLGALITEGLEKQH